MSHKLDGSTGTAGSKRCPRCTDADERVGSLRDQLFKAYRELDAERAETFRLQAALDAETAERVRWEAAATEGA